MSIEPVDPSACHPVKGSTGVSAKLNLRRVQQRPSSPRGSPPISPRPLGGRNITVVPTPSASSGIKVVPAQEPPKASLVASVTVGGRTSQIPKDQVNEERYRVQVEPSFNALKEKWIELSGLDGTKPTDFACRCQFTFTREGLTVKYRQILNSDPFELGPMIEEDLTLFLKEHPEMVPLSDKYKESLDCVRGKKSTFTPIGPTLRKRVDQAQEALPGRNKGIDSESEETIKGVMIFVMQGYKEFLEKQTPPMNSLEIQQELEAALKRIRTEEQGLRALKSSMEVAKKEKERLLKEATESLEKENNSLDLLTKTPIPSDKNDKINYDERFKEITNDIRRFQEDKTRLEESLKSLASVERQLANVDRLTLYSVAAFASDRFLRSTETAPKEREADQKKKALAQADAVSNFIKEEIQKKQVSLVQEAEKGTSRFQKIGPKMLVGERPSKRIEEQLDPDYSFATEVGRCMLNTLPKHLRTEADKTYRKAEQLTRDQAAQLRKQAGQTNKSVNKIEEKKENFESSLISFFCSTHESDPDEEPVASSYLQQQFQKIDPEARKIRPLLEVREEAMRTGLKESVKVPDRSSAMVSMEVDLESAVSSVIEELFHPLPPSPLLSFHSTPAVPELEDDDETCSIDSDAEPQVASLEVDDLDEGSEPTTNSIPQKLWNGVTNTAAVAGRVWGWFRGK